MTPSATTSRTLGRRTRPRCSGATQRRDRVTTKGGNKRRLIEWLGADAPRASGRRYQIDFDAMDVQSLRELVRLIRDLDHEKQAAANRARMMPWRR